MSPIRMFLNQSYVRRLILYTIVTDIALGYLLDRYHGGGTVLPLAVLYLLNITVLAAVYRFTKLPIFECGELGFVVYGISPFNRESCLWEKLEYVCFKELDEKKGIVKEYLILHYILPNGAHKTNMVPMYMVGYRDRLKDEFLKFLKKKGIKLECQPGL